MSRTLLINWHSEHSFWQQEQCNECAEVWNPVRLQQTKVPTGGVVLAFVTQMCTVLEDPAVFTRRYGGEPELTDHIVEVINRWVRSGPYQGLVQMTSKVKGSVHAFGWDPEIDLVIEVKDKGKVAMEIKCSTDDRKRSLFKSGLGQAVLPQVVYDYGILFVLFRNGESLNAARHNHDRQLMSFLWNQCRIRLIVHEQQIGSTVTIVTKL